MKILALDVSYSATGFYYSPTGYGVIKSSPKMHKMERLKYICKQVESLLITANPDIVIMEGYSFGSKNDREKLGELGGHVKMTIYNRKIPICIVPPTTLKKFFTGKGNASKQLMARHSKDDYGYDFKEDNITDAFALWKMLDVLGIDGLFKIIEKNKNFIPA